ncbi:MAG TPA: oligosaccharide flippase family protein [Candidatus Dormibacteraeota bacterium]|nr:oligosaccharide flippase family protein [Candidatus Dormibacteraeota bacterium]
MSGLVGRARAGGRPFLGNVSAQVGALACLTVATLMVARLGGPRDVGTFTLLRLVPWLGAIAVSAGFHAGLPYFLAGVARSDVRLPATIVATTIVTGALGAALWIAGVPFLHRTLIRDVSASLLAWACLKLLFRLFAIVGKASTQGTLDARGTNVVIFLDEFCFLPAYALVWLLGGRSDAGLVASVILADAAVSAFTWARLFSRGFWRSGGRPSWPLARRLLAYGSRAQLSNMITLLNLRLDVLILGVLTGSATVGTYAVASRYTELLRLPSQALYWVEYPRFARAGEWAAARARWLLPRAGAVTALAAAPLALAAGLVIPLLFGSGFAGAVLPAQVLAVGLAVEGVNGVVTAFLFGTGRPGLISIATGAGLAVTVALDLLLIPRLGVLGAAVASTAAYLTTDCALVLCFLLVARSHQWIRTEEVTR